MLQTDINVKRWISRGEFSAEAMNTKSIIHEAGHLLDDSCVSEIIGDACFIGEDGKTYCVNVEVSISECDEEYAKLIQDRNEEPTNAY